MKEKKAVIVTSKIELDDETYEKIIRAVWEHMKNSWVPIKSDDDLPDTAGDYLVIVRDNEGNKYQAISAFYPEKRGERWGVEGDGWETVLAWTTLPPLYEEVEE